MRVGATDYWIHYQQGRSRALYDWAASHFDRVVGGNVQQYRARNATIKLYPYTLAWTIIQRDGPALKAWLASRGLSTESVYLHKAGGAADSANRITTTMWQSARWLTNPGDSGFRDWLRERVKGMGGDGAFIDELGTGVVQQHLPAATLEYANYGAYYTAFRDMLSMLRSSVPDRIEANLTSYARAEDDLEAVAAGAMMAEFVNYPYAEIEGHWTHLEKLIAQDVVVHLTARLAASGKGATTDGATPGNYASVAQRALMWEYASYLLILDPARMDNLYFNPFANFAVNPQQAWLAAFERDIGAPSGPRRQFAAGTDSAGQQYRVWARDFAAALVLIRPKTYWGHKVAGEASAVPVELPANATWQLLNPNGSLGAPITVVHLRASEAVVLVRT
jgi:hypothetical protein